VHLPSQFAKALFDISPMGMTVVVADTKSAPSEVAHPAAIAPVDPGTGAPVEVTPLSDGEDFRWQPEKSPEGPMTILISGADQRALVFRNGIEIGRARLAIETPGDALGTHVFILIEGDSEIADTESSDLRWIAVGVPGHAGEDKKPLDPDKAARVHLPPSFRKAVHEALHPGVSLMVTDASVTETTTGVQLNVVTGDPQTLADSR
jgi:hypothetical protein